MLLVTFFILYFKENITIWKVCILFDYLIDQLENFIRVFYIVIFIFNIEYNNNRKMILLNIKNQFIKILLL
jgi:hypothetical protein